MFKNNWLHFISGLACAFAGGASARCPALPREGVDFNFKLQAAT